jgi:WhiB family transcriptional regulator, redox-sensing transcriptional regulator
MQDRSGAGALALERSIGSSSTADELLALMDMRPWWWAHAACRRQPLEVFFPPDARSSRAAKAICATCPVKTDCLEYAMAADPPLKGIFGGTTEQERRSMRCVAV